MIEALMGLAIGLPVLWLYSRMADLPALADIKSRKAAMMKRALTHTGTFRELLHMQKEIVWLALIHLRRIGIPALISTLPLILFLALRPEYATLTFGGGMLAAYIIAKWRWRI